MIFAPDSPWWLVRKGRDDAAERSIMRLTGGVVDMANMIALIKYTLELERKMQEGTSWIDLFKGDNLRRSEISFGVWMAQSLSLWIFPAPVYFFEVA